MRIITRTLGYEHYTLCIEEHYTDKRKGVRYRICELTVHKGFTLVGKHKAKTLEECIEKAAFHYGVPKDYWQYADVHDTAKIEHITNKHSTHKKWVEDEYQFSRRTREALAFDYVIAPFIKKHRKPLTIILGSLITIWLAILIYALTHKVGEEPDNTTSVTPTIEYSEDLDFVEQPDENRVLLYHKLGDSVTHIDTIPL